MQNPPKEVTTVFIMGKILFLFCMLVTLLPQKIHAQEAQTQIEGPTVAQPSIMHQQQTLESPIGSNVKTGPQQSEEMGTPPANLQHMGRIGPEQPPFGINMHLLDSAAETPKPAPAVAGPPPTVKGDFSELRQMDTASVQQVIDPLRILLKDGRIVQLSAIDIPDYDFYEPGEVSLAARRLLEKLLTGKQIRLYQTKNQKEGRLNRMGYHLAHVALAGDEGVWVQGTLLEAGLARIRPSARNPEMAGQMIALEDKARKDRRGLWSDPRFDILTPETAAQGIDGWATVQGTIASVAMANNTLYMNFGPDWHTDFTVGLDSEMRRRFAKAGLNPMQMGGMTVRVRGWLREYNGPFLELLDPAWMQLLTDSAGNIKTETTEKGANQ